MAALVQTIPQQTTTVTMLPPPPSSAGGAYTGGPSSSSHSHRASRSSPLARYGGSIGTASGYRAQAAPSVTPYTLTSTPSLSQGGNGVQGQAAPHLRQEHRTNSAPVTTAIRPSTEHAASDRATGAFSHSPVPTGGRSTVSKDDLSISASQRSLLPENRPLSSLNLAQPVSIPSTTASFSSTKPIPERYRRANRRPDASAVGPVPAGGRSAAPSGSGMATIGHLYDLPSPAAETPNLSSHQFAGQSTRLHHARSTGALGAGERMMPHRTTSVDDMQLYQQSKSEPAKRYRRQSTSELDRVDHVGLREIRNDSAVHRPDPLRVSNPAGMHGDRRVFIEPPRPNLDHHHRNGSVESVASGRSHHSRSQSPKHEPALTPSSPLTSNPVAAHNASDMSTETGLAQQPTRAVPDVTRRSPSPSPLSRPVPMTADSPEPSQPSQDRQHASQGAGAASATRNLGSPAAQQLAEVNEKDAKKGVKSRLRRALSFGSAAELRRASAENSMNNTSAERAKLRKERYQGERDAEQAAIAQKQEAAGIGAGIYSGQGGLANNSTDNLSISSTASSASIMIRKMGKGMKKSTRSLVGLFRPKSIIGAPVADAAVAPGASSAQVSMVTVEAERERVNVNVDPHDQAGGGTGYPKLERNSLDTTTMTGSGFTQARFKVEDDAVNHVRARKSIIGGEFERAEVLAAVKKGILKRTGTGSASSSPVARPADAKSTDFSLPPIPRVNESPRSSAPPTPTEEGSSGFGHRRTDSVRIEGEDYFMSLPRPGVSMSKSAPDTPQSISKYNVTFSPRIQFHDTWPSGEYDRRGETATCNRLTPMLAQQIKEELNTFKMEMEVHESSRVYTHFF
ncbi:MAG: bud neck involved protein [Peltula sp. TS41687]|nr:MAG: bud neck involved protein [Peltula sp. TS41687]